jgi:hypothetical protein
MKGITRGAPLCPASLPSSPCGAEMDLGRCMRPEAVRSVRPTPTTVSLGVVEVTRMVEVVLRSLEAAPSPTQQGGQIGSKPTVPSLGCLLEPVQGLAQATDQVRVSRVGKAVDWQ